MLRKIYLSLSATTRTCIDIAELTHGIEKLEDFMHKENDSSPVLTENDSATSLTVPEGASEAAVLIRSCDQKMSNAIGH